MTIWALILILISAVAVIVLWPLLRSSVIHLLRDDPNLVPEAHRIDEKRQITAFLIILTLALGSIGLYAEIGNPTLPSRPYLARQDDPEFIMAVATESLAQHLDEDPSPDGYEHLAALYYSSQQYDRAAEAFENVIRLNGGSAAIWSELGQVITLAQHGIVVAKARGAFAVALRFDPEEARARYFLGLFEAQHRRSDKAIAIWKDLSASTADNSPWAPMVAERVKTEAAKAHLDPATIAPLNPSHDQDVPHIPALSSEGLSSKADKDAATLLAMRPDAQRHMIEKMVAGLALRMKNDPDNLDGWERLARAYHVLGQDDKAAEAETHISALKATPPAPPEAP